MKTQKIVIKISHYKDGKEKVRAFSTMPNIGVQAYAKLIAEHPRRIKLFRRVKVKKNVINLFSRIGFIFNAIRQACSKSFAVEDIPRHQYQQGVEV